MKLLGWLFGLGGVAYIAIYMLEGEDGVVHRHAVGPLFGLMWMAAVLGIWMIALLLLRHGRN